VTPAAPQRLAAFGPVMQIAFVPEDFDAAIRYWTETVGVGPFYLLEHVSLENVKYRGAPSAIDFSMAIGYWGDVQIEFIVQHNDAPSIYKAWRDAGKSGVHHYCILTEDVGAARLLCEAQDIPVLQEGTLPGGAGEVLYVDAGEAMGGLLEILRLPQASLDLFAWMKDQAKNWDGSDPLRRLG
jgi:hypothetical protein